MLETKPRGSKVLWVVLGVVLLTHSVFLALDHSYYGNDTPSYLIPADNLLHGEGFVSDLHRPEVNRTPGYPLLLALFRISPLKIEYLILLHHGLCLLLAVAVAGIAFGITRSSLIAFTAGFVLGVDVATIQLANMLLTETTFTLFIALVCWVLYRTTRKPTVGWAAILAAGLLGGCAVLVRPIGILYFVPISIYLLLVLKRRALRPTLIFTASFLFFPLLWATRNYVETGYFGVSATGAQDILFYRAAGTLAVRRPGDYLANVSSARGLLLDQACDDLERTYGCKCSEVPEAQRAAYSVRKGTNIILHDFPGYLRTTVLGLAYIVFGGGTETLARIGNINASLAKRIVLLITLPEAVLAAMGCCYWFRRDRNLCYLLAFTIAYFLLISAGAEAYSRFRVPVMPMYALLVGGGVGAIKQSLERIWASCMTQVAGYRQATGLKQPGQ
jgi:4-amino-4-deoxy-L-arabinose transferase-like glycosyltransferase